MTTALKVLLRVVRRRMDRGEALKAILKDYPRLTGAEIAALTAALEK
ncbi:MAG: antitoxin [Ruminococcaceae bacterium]|nr:antitoxin [Oscillospiraceae bacterium]